jgi:hypothetical protein
VAAIKSNVGKAVGTVDYRSAGLFAEVQVPGDEIRMKMGFEDIFEFDPIPIQAIQVGLYFPQRVNDGGLPIGADIIGSLGQASGIDLFDIHYVRRLLWVKVGVFNKRKKGRFTRPLNPLKGDLFRIRNSEYRSEK